MTLALMALLACSSGEPEEEEIALEDLPEFAPLGGKMALPDDMYLHPVAGDVFVTALLGGKQIVHRMEIDRAQLTLKGGDVETFRGTLTGDLDTWHTVQDPTGANPERLTERDAWTRGVFFNTHHGTQALFDITWVTAGDVIILEPGAEVDVRIRGRLQLAEYTQDADFGATISMPEPERIVLKSTEPIAVFAGPEGLAREEGLEGLIQAWDIGTIGAWAYMGFQVELKPGPKHPTPIIRTPITVRRPNEDDPLEKAQKLQRATYGRPSQDVFDLMDANLSQARRRGSESSPHPSNEGSHFESDWTFEGRDGHVDHPGAPVKQ